MADVFHAKKAKARLQEGTIMIFAGGTGHPFFTTDTTACLRAAEIEADLVLKATKVDGIYSADPKKDPEAKRYDFLTYKEVLAQGLEVMDATAICLCQEQNLLLEVFDMMAEGALKRIVFGEKIGTIVGVEKP